MKLRQENTEFKATLGYKSDTLHQKQQKKKTKFLGVIGERC